LTKENTVLAIPPLSYLSHAGGEKITPRFALISFVSLRMTGFWQTPAIHGIALGENKMESRGMGCKFNIEIATPLDYGLDGSQ
jgi:hypothetical protein